MCLTFLSFGGGQDSWTILRLMISDPVFKNKYAPGDLVVVMSDTGDEHSYTLEWVKKAKILCSLHGIDFYHLTNDMGFHRKSWPDLITPQIRNEGGKFKPTMVQLGTKSCTEQLKIGPLYKFLDEWINDKYNYNFPVNKKARGCGKKAIKKFGKENGKIKVLIGFAYGEEKRAKNSKEFEQKILKKKGNIWEKQIVRIFPLIDLKMDRAKCQKYLSKFGSVPMPSNCMRCPYMAPEELLWLYINLPEKFEQWVYIEERKLQRFQGIEKNHGIMNNKKLLNHRLQIVKEKYAHLDDKELHEFLNRYKMSHGCGSGGH